jgi:hypothetical protein
MREDIRMREDNRRQTSNEFRRPVAPYHCTKKATQTPGPEFGPALAIFRRKSFQLFSLSPFSGASLSSYFRQRWLMT